MQSPRPCAHKRSGEASVSRASGFTMIEMVVVVAIILVVSAMAIPSFMNASRPYKIRNDANALSGLINVARMRATSEVAHVQVVCYTTTAPNYCKLQSSVYPNATTWVDESQKVYLSAGVSFGIPGGSATVPNQSGTGAYQGDAAQGVSTTPAVVFNSRGWPVDATSGATPTWDYALYLHDTSNRYMAVAVGLTGQTAVYQYANNTFCEYTDGAPTVQRTGC